MEDLCVARWHSNRIFFVSSAMGIAGKKDNADDDETWIDDDLYQVYDEKQKRFSDPAHKNYTQLYRYNIIAENRLQELCRQADAAAENERVLYNSGIRSVEDEISLFAQKYAAYNKCTQAQQYLQQAIEIAGRLTAKAQTDAEELRQQLNANIDNKTDSLSNELKDSCEKLKAEIPANAADYITKHAPSTQEIQDLQNTLDTLWEKIKKDKTIKDNKSRQATLADMIAPQYDHAVKGYLNSLQNVIEGSAFSSSSLCRETLCKVVNESSRVNPSDREKLKNIILDYPHITIPQQIKLNQKVRVCHWLLWFPWERDEKLSNRNMHEFVETQFKQQQAQYTSSYVKQYQDSLQQWIDALGLEIMSNLSDFNPALRQMNQKLQTTMREKESLVIQQDKLLNNQNIIENLLEIEGVY